MERNKFNCRELTKRAVPPLVVVLSALAAAASRESNCLRDNYQFKKHFREREQLHVCLTEEGFNITEERGDSYNLEGTYKGSRHIDDYLLVARETEEICEVLVLKEGEILGTIDVEASYFVIQILDGRYFVFYDNYFGVIEKKVWDAETGETKVLKTDFPGQFFGRLSGCELKEYQRKIESGRG